MIVAPAAIPGIGQAGGFEFVLADTSGGSLDELCCRDRRLPRPSQQAQGALPRLDPVQRPTCRKSSTWSTATGLASLAFRSRTSSARCRPTSGGNYINDFNLFGRTFRVTAEAEASARTLPERSTRCTCAHRRATWCRCPRWCRSSRRRGPAYIERYNVFRAVTINGAPAPGYSQGDAIHAMESARQGVARATSPITGRARCSNRSARAARRRISSRWRSCSCSWCWPPSTRAGSCRSRSFCAFRSPCSAPFWGFRCAAWRTTSMRRSAW